MILNTWTICISFCCCWLVPIGSHSRKETMVCLCEWVRGFAGLITHVFVTNFWYFAIQQPINNSNQQATTTGNAIANRAYHFICIARISFPFHSIPFVWRCGLKLNDFSWNMIYTYTLSIFANLLIFTHTHLTYGAIVSVWSERFRTKHANE